MECGCILQSICWCTVHHTIAEVGGCLTFRVSGLESLLAFGPFDWATKRAVSFIHRLALSIP